MGKLIGRPSLINILGGESANMPEFNYGHLRNLLSRKLVIWTCNSATRLIAVSEYQINILKKYGLKRAQVNKIPWGVKSEMFFPINQERMPPLKILHVANLNEVKDQETLIKAFEIIQKRIPAVLRIVGPDYLNGKIQKLVDTLNLQQGVSFEGFILYSEIAKHYQWADVFILTSLSEGQNNAITEAMMCGLLPLSTPVGIMEELGEDVGIMFNKKDFKSLANQIIELYSQPDKWKRKCDAALQWASAHDFNWTMSKTRELISSVIEASK
jgi:glycosyltransferase involved in cell wall biosynthesis